MVDHPRVLALVLTHDAPGALDRCLRAIDAQTRLPERVLVVDNASRVPAVLGERAVAGEVLRRTENDGPAGGHAAGLAAFLASDADVAWVMDDDCIPAAECLAQLLARRDALDAARPIFPLWVDGPTGDARFLPAWCGFVIPRRLVERIGLPRADFVWWAEDTEYLQWRILEAGVEPANEPSAVVEHHRVRSNGAKPAWKMYYEVRNTIVYRVYIQRWNLTHARLLLRSLTLLFGQALRSSPRLPMLRAYASGVFDGVRRKLGLRVPLA